MTDGSALEIKRPRTDDRAVWDALFGLYGYTALVVGYRLGLFSVLAERPRTVSEVCEALGIEPRPADVILTAAVSLGFLDLCDGRYSLTTAAEDYLLESSPTYFGFVFDLTAAQEDVLSISALERAVRTNTSQVFGGEHVFDAL